MKLVLTMLTGWQRCRTHIDNVNRSTTISNSYCQCQLERLTTMSNLYSKCRYTTTLSIWIRIVCWHTYQRRRYEFDIDKVKLILPMSTRKVDNDVKLVFTMLTCWHDVKFVVKMLIWKFWQRCRTVIGNVDNVDRLTTMSNSYCQCHLTGWQRCQTCIHNVGIRQHLLPMSLDRLTMMSNLYSQCRYLTTMSNS